MRLDSRRSLPSVAVASTLPYGCSSRTLSASVLARSPADQPGESLRAFGVNLQRAEGPVRDQLAGALGEESRPAALAPVSIFQRLAAARCRSSHCLSAIFELAAVGQNEKLVVKPAHNILAVLAAADWLRPGRHRLRIDRPPYFSKLISRATGHEGQSTLKLTGPARSAVFTPGRASRWRPRSRAL